MLHRSHFNVNSEMKFIYNYFEKINKKLFISRNIFFCVMGAMLLCSFITLFCFCEYIKKQSDIKSK